MCETPTIAYICGYKLSKDGVMSPSLEFAYNRAMEYYSRISPDRLVAEKMMIDNEISLPCGKCAICQIQKRKDMSVRLAHEASVHEDACFITLTYDDKYLPMTSIGDWTDKKRDVESEISILRGDVFGLPTLLPSDVQKFLKRLRRHLEYIPKKSDGRDHVTKPIRYFCVGEYGGKTHRPHYHIMIFGWKPSDMIPWELRKKYTIYRSAQIEKLWCYGFSTVGDVNAGVAKYCARYVTKKLARLEEMTPDEKAVCPEFFLQSVRNGGMGSPWLSKWYNNLKTGFVTVRSGIDRISRCSIPRYYYNRLRKINLSLWLELREERIEFVRSRPRVISDDEAIALVDEMQRLVACDKELYHYQISLETI